MAVRVTADTKTLYCWQREHEACAGSVLSSPDAAAVVAAAYTYSIHEEPVGIPPPKKAAACVKLSRDVGIQYLLLLLLGGCCWSCFIARGHPGLLYGVRNLACIFVNIHGESPHFTWNFYSAQPAYLQFFMCKLQISGLCHC